MMLTQCCIPTARQVSASEWSTFRVFSGRHDEAMLDFYPGLPVAEDVTAAIAELLHGRSIHTNEQFHPLSLFERRTPSPPAW